jgi:hypothetical protein
VTASKYSFPTVCKEDQATDWFNSLQKCLHWNKRERQKSFAIVESNRQKSSPSTPKANTPSLNMTKPSRKNSSGPSSNASSPSQKKHDQSFSLDSMTDKVFAMFIEDEYRQDSEEEEEHLSRHFFESDEDSFVDDNSSVEDGFNGWTDDEILKARSSSQAELNKTL